MIYLLGLDLHKVVVFEQASVDFKEGITYVRGINLDSDPAQPTGNAVGKTLLFSAIPNLRYQATHLSDKKKARKELLRQRGSSIGAIVIPEKDGPEYEIVQTGAGYTFYENGTDLKVRTLPRQEEFLRGIFPLETFDFYAYCFLSTQRPYAIQTDKDVERLVLFSELFRLNQYDALKDYFLKQGRVVSDNEVKLSVLEQSRLELASKIKKLKAPVDEEKYLALKASVEKAQEDRDALLKKQRDLNTRKATLASLYKIEKELDVLRGEWKHSKAPDAMLPVLKSLKRDAEDWAKYEHALEFTNTQRRKLEAKLEQLGKPSQSSSEAKAALDKAKASIDKDANTLSKERGLKEEYDDWRSAYSKSKKEFAAFGIPESDIDLKADFGDEQAQCRVTLRLQKLLDHAHDDDVQCPTCLSSLDLANIKASVKNAERRLSKIQALTGAQSALRALKKLDAKRPEQPSADLIETLEARLAKSNKILQKAEEVLSLHDRIKSVKSQIRDLDTPERPERDAPKMDMESIEHTIDLCHSISKHLEAKKRVLEEHAINLRSAASVKVEIQATDKALAELAKSLSSQERTASKMCAQLAEYDQYHNSLRLYKSELSAVELKLEGLKDGVANKKIISILQKAYSNKGLKAQAAEGVCRLFQINLNHYRDLIFFEPFEFSVVATEQGIAINVDRNNGKPDAVSDVRHLSGAESNAFRLLSFISLLPLIPYARRLNLAILDEPTSHMDAAYRNLFKERFIPVLRELVPTVIIISPHEDDICENSFKWTITKQDGVSTLTTG